MTKKSSTSFHAFFKQFKMACNGRIISYGVIAGGIYAPECILGDLYGATFIHHKFGLPIIDATNISLTFYIGLAVGSIVLPYISEKTDKTDFFIALSLIAKAVLFAGLLYIPSVNINVTYIFFIGIGFFSGAFIMCFTAAWKAVPERCSALTAGIIDSLGTTVNAIYQYIVGYLIDVNWNGDIGADGARLYTINHFTTGLSFLPFMLVMCFMMSCIIIRMTNKQYL